MWGIRSNGTGNSEEIGYIWILSIGWTYLHDKIDMLGGFLKENGTRRLLFFFGTWSFNIDIAQKSSQIALNSFQRVKTSHLQDACIQKSLKYCKRNISKITGTFKTICASELYSKVLSQSTNVVAFLTTQRPREMGTKYFRFHREYPASYLSWKTVKSNNALNAIRHLLTPFIDIELESPDGLTKRNGDKEVKTSPLLLGHSDMESREVKPLYYYDDILRLAYKSWRLQSLPCNPKERPRYHGGVRSVPG